MTCASPFGMAFLQSNLASGPSGDQLRMLHASAGGEAGPCSSQQAPTSFTPACTTTSSQQQAPQALSTGLLRQFSACGLDSCTRERIRQQEQMGAAQQAAGATQECSQGTDWGLQSQSSLLSQHAPPTKVPAFASRASAFPAPRRLELSQNLSQEFLRWVDPPSQKTVTKESSPSSCFLPPTHPRPRTGLALTALPVHAAVHQGAQSMACCICAVVAALRCARSPPSFLRFCITTCWCTRTAGVQVNTCSTACWVSAL